MIPSRFTLVSLFASFAFLPCSAAWIQALDSERPRAPKIFALAVVGEAVVAGFETGIWRTFDRGRTWEQANIGMGDAVLSFTLASQDSLLYSAGVGGGIWRSSDRAAHWTRMGLAGEYVSCLSPRGTSLYAGTCCNGVFRTRNGGATWDTLGLKEQFVSDLEWKGSSLFAATGDGLWRSDDSGDVWKRAGAGLPDGAVRSLAAGEGGLMLASAGDGVYRSIDAGATWTRVLSAPRGAGVAVIEGDLAFASAQQAVFRSRDAGATWGTFTDGIPDQHGVSSLALAGSDLFAGVLGAGVWRRAAIEPEAVGVRAKPGSSSAPGRSSLALPPVDGRLRNPDRRFEN